MLNYVAWICFSRLRGIGRDGRQKLLDIFNTPEEIISIDPMRLYSYGFSDAVVKAIAEADMREAELIYKRCRSLGVDVITISEDKYPPLLKNITDPPLVLYVKGEIPLPSDRPLIGIVGTRDASDYGIKMAGSITSEIAKSGAVVVTGLAGGVDTEVAESALAAGGKVVGVLGTAINKIYPYANKKLFERVAKNGALVSEYCPDSPTSRSGFALRNRIIAGLSQGTVVIEAPLSSGALITAHCAQDEGRDVFAVPGCADSENSVGCNNLIRNGAKITVCACDVLQEYEGYYPGISKGCKRADEDRTEVIYKKAAKNTDAGPGIAAEAEAEPIPELQEELPELYEPPEGLSKIQSDIIAVMDKPSMNIEEISERTGIASNILLSELTMLQIKGIIKSLGRKNFSLNNGR